MSAPGTSGARSGERVVVKQAIPYAWGWSFALLLGVSQVCGQITPLYGPNVAQSMAKAVNDQGVVIGDYLASNENRLLSFRYTPSAGMQQIPLPAGMTQSEV